MAIIFQSVTPITAASYLATLGVNTHIPYTDGGYANIQNVIADLKYIGINQVRDSISNGQNGSAPLSSYIDLAQAGIHFTFIVSGPNTAAVKATLALIDQVETAVPGSITAVEGPNEINNQPINYNGVAGLAGAVNEQKDIYKFVHADPKLTGVKVDYFTGYDAGNIALGPDPASTPGLADADNQHPYPNNGLAPAAQVGRAQSFPNTTSKTFPGVYTETGYTSNQVNTTVQAKYTLDLLLDTAKQGISKTYLYELMDAYAPSSPQGDAGFGLFDDTKTAKPVATALHNFTALLKDTGAKAASFTPSALSYAITGLPSDGNSMLLEKSDGSYVLVVWAEPQIWNNTTHKEVAAPSENVTVSLPASYTSIQVFDPRTGLNAIASYTNVNSVTVTITDHPILIDLTKAAAATPRVTPKAETTGSNTLTPQMWETAYQGNDTLPAAAPTDSSNNVNLSDLRNIVSGSMKFIAPENRDTELISSNSETDTASIITHASLAALLPRSSANAALAAKVFQVWMNEQSGIRSSAMAHGMAIANSNATHHAAALLAFGRG